MATPFSIREVHGIGSLSGNDTRVTSAELGWKTLFVSEQREEPFEARVAPVNDHLLVLHMTGPVRVDGEVDGKGARSVVPPGGLYFWPGGSSFKVGLESAVKTLHLYIRRWLVEDMAAEFGCPAGMSLTPWLCESDALIEQLALEVGRASHSREHVEGAYVDHLASAIAARILRRNMAALRPEREVVRQGLCGTRLKRVVDYIEANLGGDVGLNALSAASGLSVSHFVRQFKLATGQSPHQFVLHRRVDRAKRLLGRADESIAQIAFVCGFSNQEHLTHTFKRLTGGTPALYRKAVQV
jgi:AraC family transcriptional regulator